MFSENMPFHHRSPSPIYHLLRTLRLPMSIVLPKVSRPDIHTVDPKCGKSFCTNLPCRFNDKDIYSAVNEGETTAVQIRCPETANRHAWRFVYW